MTFKMKYEITQDYIRFGNSRSGQPLIGVWFLTSHDTGNEGSTAYQNRSHFHNNQPVGSAHTFIDDKYILEILPLNEKAWHVVYDTPIDNHMFGEDANDVSIGTELCWGGNIEFNEAYKRYVWYHAYLCWKHKLDPSKQIVSHKILDPKRRNDPDNALNRYGITYEQFLYDVAAEYEECSREDDDNMPMKLEQWQWDMLYQVMGKSYNDDQLDWDWMQKIVDKTLTAAELAFLNTVLDGRIDRKIEV